MKKGLLFISVLAGMAMTFTGCDANVNVNIPDSAVNTSSGTVSSVSEQKDKNDAPAVTDSKSEKNDAAETNTEIRDDRKETENIQKDTENTETAADSNSETENTAGLGDLLEYALNKDSGSYMGVSCDRISSAMKDSGFDDEQIDLLISTGIFSKFSEYVVKSFSEDNKTDSGRYLTGYSYDSYLKLMDHYFTEDAEYITTGYDYDSDGNSTQVLHSNAPAEYFSPENVSGELAVADGGVPSCSAPAVCTAEITEKTDSRIRFVLHCGRQSEWGLGEYKGKYENPDADIAAFLADTKITSGFGPHFAGAEYTEENGYLVILDYTEELVKTSEGWKLSRFEDFRRN